MDLATIIFLICAIIGSIVGIIGIVIAILEKRKSKQQELQLKVIINYFPDIKLDFFPKTKEEFKKKLEKEPALIREDLLEEEMYISSPISRYKLLIEKLNKYLDKRDIDIIIMASAVCRAQDEEKHSLAQQLHFSLVETYGERGKRIFNRLNTNVFEEQVAPFLRELERFLPNDILRISKMLQEYFDNLIQKEVVDRLWVSRNDDYNSVLSRIWGKFSNYKKLNLLYVYVRKEYNVAFTEMACKQFVAKNSNEFYLEKSEPKQMRGRIAVTFKIIRKNKTKKKV